MKAKECATFDEVRKLADTVDFEDANDWGCKITRLMRIRPPAEWRRFFEAFNCAERRKEYCLYRIRWSDVDKKFADAEELERHRSYCYDHMWVMGFGSDRPS